MTTAPLSLRSLTAAVCARALDARDARFDGVFFVGITTTRIYCRPVCPARISYPERRRFFDSAPAAEQAGYRPCLRCRPELAPGRAIIDAVPRLAQVAAQRIAAGALNGRGVPALAGDLGVSERHLRRALDHELGVSPVELAQTHRLLLAKRLLADTALPVTRVAYASGFQSLRRFNSVFRERYRLAPSALRRSWRTAAPHPAAAPRGDDVRLTLAYRAPLAWDALIETLAAEALPGAELVTVGRYARTIQIDGKRGVVSAADTSGAGASRKAQITVDISAALVPVLMPLLARLRHMFDLDADPAAVDTALARGRLAELVRCSPGLRIPGALNAFEIALRALLRGPELAARVVAELGEPMETAMPALTRHAPTPERVADAGIGRLVALGLGRRPAGTLVALARALADGVVCVEPGGDAAATHRALLTIDGVGDRLATLIVMRALYWPDAFPASDRALQRAVGVPTAARLSALAEQWRPWRAYAALHLWRSAPSR